MIWIPGAFRIFDLKSRRFVDGCRQMLGLVRRHFDYKYYNKIYGFWLGKKVKTRVVGKISTFDAKE